jgi:hypothetical protein
VVATERRSSGTSGSTWRWALAVVLVAGIAWVVLRHPAVPAESWPDASVYRPEDAVCRDARAGRQWTSYRVPDAMEAPEGVTVTEVARRFNLEPAPVRRANDMDDLAACGETQIEPGRLLALPLTSDDEAVAAARTALQDAASESGEG